MRRICLALTMALGAAGAAADWVEIVAGKERSVEIDRASILQSDPGTKVAWGRIVMSDAEAGDAGYKSVKALNRYDCRAATFSTIKRVYLDAEQRVIREERIVGPKVFSVTSGSIDERLFREVCQPPSVDRLADIAEQAAEAARQAGETGPSTEKEAEQPSHAGPDAGKAEADKPASTDDPTPLETVHKAAAESDSPAAGHGLVPRIVQPLSEAEKRVAVAARLAAMEHFQTTRVKAEPAGQHDVAAQAEQREMPAAEPKVAPAPASSAGSRHASKPETVLARSAPRRSHKPSGNKAEKRAPQAATMPSHVEWSYRGAGGPDNWAALKPEFALCGDGRRQSPIDIDDGIHVDLAPIEFSYRPTYFRIVDNGHTVQVGVGEGSSIRVMGRVYDLKQFHFHRPSEFRIDGRGYDMEAHLVHQDLDGRLAVVSVMLERGTAHQIVQTLWNNLPLERHSSYAPDVAIDPNELLPEDRRYATFMGSLTTPPCTEGVMWMVMRQPVQVSAEQISIFSRLHPMNARPLQPIGDRLVKISR